MWDVCGGADQWECCMGLPVAWISMVRVEVSKVRFHLVVRLCIDQAFLWNRIEEANQIIICGVECGGVWCVGCGGVRSGELARSLGKEAGDHVVA